MNKGNSIARYLHLFSGIALLAGFFLPWVNWKETAVSGYQFPSGTFFGISASQFNLANPFPQLNFTFLVFWLVPLFTVMAMALSFGGRKFQWLALIAGALNLSLLSIFYLFTHTLSDLGVTHSFQPGCWVSALASALFILTSFPPKQWWVKLGWLLIGPLFAYGSFLYIQKTVWNQTFDETASLQPDFTISADQLLKEFADNDSAANKKYREKIIQVNGKVSNVEMLKDSTVNVKFEDSTGSYIIFPFEKTYFTETSRIKSGDELSAKGSCSGSIRSEILGTTSISFKRSILIKK